MNSPSVEQVLSFPFKIVAIAICIVFIIGVIYSIIELVERRQTQKSEDDFSKAEEAKKKEEEEILKLNYENELRRVKNRQKNTSL